MSRRAPFSLQSQITGRTECMSAFNAPRCAKLRTHCSCKTSVMTLPHRPCYLIDAKLVRTQCKKCTTTLDLLLLVHWVIYFEKGETALTYPVISLSMTIFCRPVDRLLLGRPGEPTRSVGDATGAPVGFVRAAFTSRRIRANGPSFVTVL